ncbi:hypothetical protein F2Q69_00043222 [Brassica cretica]|uniref:Uncharacterized protein n=1 Tax=Brassica cretica TaxID=69181 RepID=A0A8S9NQD2_BRACR|nr:hypothetical protein F2Q69_00043222 [Brassica cretica]
MTKLMSKSPQRIGVNIFTEDTHRKKNLYKESHGKILFKSRLNQIPAVPRQHTRIQTSHRQARVWQSDHGQANHDRYAATKHVHCSVTTLRPSTRATELSPKLSCYVVTEHAYGLVAT